jgi:hypothetical protein
MKETLRAEIRASQAETNERISRLDTRMDRFEETFSRILANTNQRLTKLEGGH